MDGHSALRYSPGVIVPDATTIRVAALALRLDAEALDADGLRAPWQQDDGSWRYEAVADRADAPLVYPWGTEVATEAALSDPAYRQGLVGLAVTVHHPASGVHRVDEAGEEVGRIVGSRWDAARRLGVVDFVVSKRRAHERIQRRELTEVSVGYSVPDLHMRADGVGEQRRRRGNHVALTPRGRMPGATIRTDEVSMDPETIKALEALLDAREARRNDAAVTAITAERDAAVKRADALCAAIGVAPDATPEAVTAAIVARTDEIVAVRQRASANNVALPESGTAQELRRVLAIGLGADPKRIDALGDAYAQAVIDHRGEVRTDSASSTTSSAAPWRA